jgi:peptide/nickel transport system substrate-binding protein
MVRVFAALLACGCACTMSLRWSAHAQGAPQTLRIGLVEQPNSLDPLHAIEFYENYLAEAIFSGLTVIDDRGNVAPDLAERVPTRENGDISADGKTIVYHLRPNVRWQDGVPLTSHDVAFTFAKMREPATNFVESSVYSIIDRVDAPDDRTVVLHLRSAWADATAELFVGGQNGSIVPEHVLRDTSASSFESAPVGSGPYSVERWERGSRIVLGANADYFRGPPQIERIEFDFVPDQNTLGLQVRTGELDFSPQIPQAAAIALRGARNVRQRTATTYDDVELGFNTKRAPFDDARLRLALAIAIDRTRLVDTVYHGFADSALGLVPPQSPMYAAAPGIRPGGDTARAERLLDAAGWRRGADGLRRKRGVPLAVVITTESGYPANAAIAIQLQATWKALGADVSLRPVAANVLLAPVTGLLVRGDFDAYVVPDGYATSADRADTLTTSGFPPAGRNYTRYASPEVDRETLVARRTFDAAKRRAMYARIARRVLADAALTPLLWQKTIYVYNDRLEGLRPEPVNSDLWNVYQWRLRAPTR